MQDISTVDRLDKPSSYYAARVSISCEGKASKNELTPLQKKRRYGRDHEEDDKKADEVDPLKNATTLYVGNLYVL